jgi:hypothetical protein
VSRPTVLSTVRSALTGQPVAPWQRHLALALAGSMDERPAASTAKELRTLLTEILGEDAAKAQAAKAVDPVDDITARIAARRASSGS